jgi:hypothetical protein
LSHSHGCELTNSSKESQHPARRPLTASQYSSKLARLRHPSSHDHDLKVHLHTRSITASKFISKLARSRPRSASPNSLNRGLQSRSITASNCISKLARSRPPSASPNSLDHGPGMYPCVHSIVIFRRTSNCSQAPPAASPDIPCVDG